MPRMLHHDRMVNLFIRAMNGGAQRVSLNRLIWQCHGNCLNPWVTEVYGRPRNHSGDPFRPDKHFTFKGGQMPLCVEISTRCRKCDKCRKARADEWRYRAREELRRAARSWFGTLTLSPAAHYRVLCEARAHASARAVPWATLTDDERFKRVALTSLKEVTKYIKRVRKQSGVPLRYICVTERHKSGLPHFHLLVHEVELRPVTHKILSSQWTLGFEKWRLVPFEDLNSARYVTKYLTKDAKTRIRASQLYGQPQATVGAVVASIQRTSYDVDAR